MTILTHRWWTLALRGLAAIAFGILSFIWPGRSFFVLVLLFGIYALIDGGFNLVMAFRSPGERWGSLVFEGIASLVAGVVAIVWPGITALVLLMVIASWSVVTGIFEIVAAIRLRKELEGEWLLALTGILSIAFGVVLFLFPKAGALALALWIGAFAIVFGALLLALGLKLRSLGRSPHSHFPDPHLHAPA